MIVLIPLLLLALALLALKWALERTDLRKRVYLAAIGIGWGSYGAVGVLIPHTDPHTWHYLSAPAISGLVMLIGFMIVKARGGAF